MKGKINNINKENAKWIYDNLLLLRNEENKHYGDNVRLILASQTGLLAIYAVAFDKVIKTYPIVIFFISLMGLSFSLLLFQVIRGGMYWVIYWQQQMKRLEEDAVIDTRIFANLPSKYQGKKARRALHPGVTPVDLSLTILLLGGFLLLFWFVIVCFSILIWFRVISPK